MSQDPTSLERLHDLVLPAPTPFWPPAPGWLWLLGFAVVVTVTLLLVGFARWQRNRYRREALSELARLESRSGQADVLVELSELLKRTALTAYPRSQVAALSGPSWFAFLDGVAGTRFSAGLGDKLEQALYRSAAAALEPAELDASIREVRAWIRQHQAPLADGSAAPSEPAGEVAAGLRGAA